MNKNNIVRLTESQLHQVIKESVKQVLSELDWKTYANAARKANSNGDDRLRASLFGVAAEREFRKKHGLKDVSSHSNFIDNEPFVSLDEPYENGYIAYGNKENPFTKSVDSFYQSYDVPISDIDKSRLSHIQGDAFGAQKDLEDYQNGNYEYQKGKGWQKKNR